MYVHRQALLCACCKSHVQMLRIRTRWLRGHGDTWECRRVLVWVHAVTVSHLASERLCCYALTAVNGEQKNLPLRQKNSTASTCLTTCFVPFRPSEVVFSLFQSQKQHGARPSVRLSRCYGKNHFSDDFSENKVSHNESGAGGMVVKSA